MKLNFRTTVLYVKDVKESINFYEKAFGFERKFIAEGEVYGELNIGNTNIGFSKEEFVKNNIIRTDFHKNSMEKIPSGFEIAFVSEDVEESFKKAVDAGAQIILKPTKMQWGQTVAYLRDINGIIIEIFNEVSNFNK